jgi:membrane associated rhomboid family serine protease
LRLSLGRYHGLAFRTAGPCIKNGDKLKAGYALILCRSIHTNNLYQEWQQSFDEFVKRTVTLPASIRGMAQYSYYWVAQSWVNLTEGKEMTYKLVGCFSAVYLLGFLPVTRGLVRRYVSHDPLSGRIVSLFTSQFGHAGLVHLAVNSFALIGFGERSFLLRWRRC